MTVLRHYLTDDERAIRHSRGISLWRFWPFVLIVLVLMILSLDNELFTRCLGNPMNAHAGGVKEQEIAAAVRMILSIPCGVYAFRGGSFLEHLSAAALFGAIPFAVMQIRWMRRHKAYWDGVRARESLKRQENKQ